MIFNYKTFLIESILHTSDELLDILYEIDHPIADDFISLIDSDIETRYNLLNLTDKNDKISFLPDEQAQRKLKTQDLDYLLNKSSNTINIGRLVRKLLLTNGFKYHDSEIERFVNMFKATYDINKKGYIIKSVKGGELRKWHHEDNHCMDAVNGKGTLGNSCMKYDECQDFFDIYVDNPDVCKLVVLVVIKDGVEKLSARGILWKTNIGYYLDRVYYTYDSEVHLLAKWAYENYNCTKSYDKGSYSNNMTIKLKDDVYEQFPYFDTFAFQDIQIYQNRALVYLHSLPSHINRDIKRKRTPMLMIGRSKQAKPGNSSLLVRSYS